MQPAGRRIAAHFLYSGQELVPDPVLSISADGTVVGIEYNAQRDSLCGVEFYSGILLPGMVCPRASLEAAARSRGGDFMRAAEFLDAAMWSAGVQVLGDARCGAADPLRQIRLRSRIIYMETDACSGREPLFPAAGLFGPGTDVCGALHAVTLGGARALGVQERFGRMECGKRCGVVLLGGADMRTMTLTDCVQSRRIV